MEMKLTNKPKLYHKKNAEKRTVPSKGDRARMDGFMDTHTEVSYLSTHELL